MSMWHGSPRAWLVVVCAGLVSFGAEPRAQQTGTPLFRLFLESGEALPIHGDYAVAGDRVVFMLVVGEAGSAALQLMSLPASDVDLERSGQYAEAIRSGYYASTWGELDYQAIRAEVSSALGQIVGVADPTRRLALAAEARTQLLAWSRAHYNYRADEIRELAGLFDEVIAELRIAAGESTFSLDLTTGPPAAPAESLRPAPGGRESIELAIRAAAAADIPEERMAILDVARVAASLDPALTHLVARVAVEIEAERTADAAYADLETLLVAQAEAAARRADVDGIKAIVGALASRDASLGSRRPERVRSIEVRLGDVLERAVAFRLTLDRYQQIRGRLLGYERGVRPAWSTFDGVGPVLLAIRDVADVSVFTLDKSEDRLQKAASVLSAEPVPEDLADVHATMVSAVQMAVQATVRRRMAIATASAARAREAASAGAGALLLAGQARDELVRRLFPPTFD